MGNDTYAGTPHIRLGDRARTAYHNQQSVAVTQRDLDDEAHRDADTRHRWVKEQGIIKTFASWGVILPPDAINHHDTHPDRATISVDGLTFSYWQGRIQLTDSCPNCGRTRHSDVIKTLADLGAALATPNTFIAHQCPATLNPITPDQLRALANAAYGAQQDQLAAEHEQRRAKIYEETTSNMVRALAHIGLIVTDAMPIEVESTNWNNARLLLDKIAFRTRGETLYVLHNCDHCGVEVESTFPIGTLYDLGVALNDLDATYGYHRCINATQPLVEADATEPAEIIDGNLLTAIDDYITFRLRALFVVDGDDGDDDDDDKTEVPTEVP